MTNHKHCNEVSDLYAVSACEAAYDAADQCHECGRESDYALREDCTGKRYCGACWEELPTCESCGEAGGKVVAVVDADGLPAIACSLCAADFDFDSDVVTEEENDEAATDAGTFDGLMTSEDFYHYQEMLSEIQAERAAERYYEDAGWQEALLDSYVESGFISRY